MDYRWGTATKRLVLTAGLVLVGVIIYVVRDILPLVGASAVLAYLLQPPVGFLVARGVRRGLAVVLVFVLLIAAVAAVPLLLVPAIVRSAERVGTGDLLKSLVWSATALLSEYRTVSLGGYAFNLGPLVDPLLQRLSAVGAGSLPNLVGLFGFVIGEGPNAVLALLGMLGTLVIVLIVTFYLVLDTPLIRQGAWSFVPEGARPEMKVLAARLNAVWAAFFRGQLLLAAVVGGTVAVGGFAIGLPGALWLGLVAGVLEVVPTVGPILAAVPAVAVALLQGSTLLAVDHTTFALITLGMYFLLHQLEHSTLVPHILGHAVGLPPALVLLGALAGASLAGLLGVFLATPLIASLALITRYAYNKLLDRPPFDDMPATDRAAPTVEEAAAAIEEEAAEERAIEEHGTLAEREAQVGEKTMNAE